MRPRRTRVGLTNSWVYKDPATANGIGRNVAQTSGARPTRQAVRHEIIAPNHMCRIDNSSGRRRDETRERMPTVGKVAFDMHGGEIIGLLGPNETCKTVPFNLPELAAITLEPGGRDVR